MQIVYYHVSSIDSTNSLAKQQSSLWNKEALTVVIAEEQTAGRGKFERQWITTKGKDIAVSFVLFTGSDFIQDVPFATAIAVAKTLDLPNTRFKWPNDVLVNEKKICGILVETTPIGDKTCLVIGVGINVLSSEGDWAGIGQPVTSVFLESQKAPELETLIQRLSQNIHEIIPKTLEKGFSFIKNQYHHLMI